MRRLLCTALCCIALSSQAVELSNPDCTSEEVLVGQISLDNTYIDVAEFLTTQYAPWAETAIDRIERYNDADARQLLLDGLDITESASNKAKALEYAFADYDGLCASEIKVFIKSQTEALTAQYSPLIKGLALIAKSSD